jgi:hypothetical protein
MRRVHWVMYLAAALAPLLLAPATASAATPLGQLAPTPINCSGNANNVQLSVNSGTSYEVPSAGVITSWSHQAKEVSPGFAGSGRLQLWRPLGGTSFTLVGRSDLMGFSVGLNQFGVRVPVNAGDLLGFRVGPGGVGAACQFPGGAGLGTIGNDAAGSSDAVPGETRDLPTEFGRLNVAAILEPDCDQDGFGDESQDAAVDCVSPETHIIKGPKDKTKKKKATFEFSSSEPSVSFECSVDGQPFIPCTSPDTVKVKKGRHNFQVRARDAAGNVDPTPASDDWKVKKRRQR